MEQTNGYEKRLNTLPDYSGNEGMKRRNPNDEKEPNGIGPDDTVYRYLCSLRKIGSIIGIGGDIAKQLRAETHAKIRISETIPGCDERVVTIYSTSDETNSYEEDPVSPAQDALFRVHDRVVAEESPVNGAFEEPLQVTVRLLVPSDQIGCVIGKGGQIIQNIRTETGVQIRILGSEHLPPCALSSDELIQLSGEATVVKKALYQVAYRLHDNPSRSQYLLLSASSIYRSGIAFNNPNVGGPLVGVVSSMGPYGSSYTAKEFSLRLICPPENIGAVIGKGGVIIKQIRQESGAFIKVDSSVAEGEDCVISISAKETFDAPSRTIDATMRLQPRCSERSERESGDPVFTTRLLVPSSRIGCLIGKGGAIVKEMRKSTRANIRILSDEHVHKVASEDDEMVQITGDTNAARAALLQVVMRLRANMFETEGTSSGFSTPAPYRQTSPDISDGPKYMGRDNRSRNHGYSTYSGGYGSKNLPPSESYRSYDTSQIVGESNYGAYGVYSSGHSGVAGLSSQNPVSSEKSYNY
ncbi:KH domain-containing protein HEN4-like [Olea europaea var. sylvestris]|uniref:KH domain-containing protein HEN4-like n=1 Tax=Olea europaea var. sylvestris TaxID=158386 RepID=UPI000C1D8CFB|nr:KH domain-containing protein HEN4-like [Olea europaea var. sylvestris]XP_022891167.1 KH domain-containing protein HEN4-like [Olea europaea var. sylvestris]